MTLLRLYPRPLARPLRRRDGGPPRGAVDRPDATASTWCAGPSTRGSTRRRRLASRPSRRSSAAASGRSSPPGSSSSPRRPTGRATCSRSSRSRSWPSRSSGWRSWAAACARAIAAPGSFGVTAAIATLGYGSWLAMLALTATGWADGPALAAAQTVAIVGTTLIGATLVRDGDTAVGGLITAGGLAMLIPWSAGWLVFGTSWTAVGLVLWVERRDSDGADRVRLLTSGPSVSRRRPRRRGRARSSRPDRAADRARPGPCHARARARGSSARS